MAYITTPGFAGIDLSEVSTLKKIPLGTEVQGSDGNTWMYVQCDANPRNSGEALFIDNNGTLRTAITTAQSGVAPQGIGFFQHNVTASGYTWVVVKGMNFLGQSLTGCNPDVKSYTNSSSGTYFDDDPSGHDLIQGLRGNVTGAQSTDISVSSAGYPEVNAQD